MARSRRRGVSPAVSVVRAAASATGETTRTTRSRSIPIAGTTIRVSVVPPARVTNSSPERSGSSALRKRRGPTVSIETCCFVKAVMTCWISAPNCTWVMRWNPRRRTIGSPRASTARVTPGERSAPELRSRVDSATPGRNEPPGLPNAVPRFVTLPDGKGRHLPWRGRTAGFALSPRVGQCGAGQPGDQDAGDDRFSPEVGLHEPLPAPAAREPPIGPSRSSCQPLTWSPHGFRSLGAVRATSTRVADAVLAEELASRPALARAAHAHPPAVALGRDRAPRGWRSWS